MHETPRRDYAVPVHHPLVQITVQRVPAVPHEPPCATCGAARDAHSQAAVGPFQVPLCAMCAGIGLRAMQILAWIASRVDAAGQHPAAKG